MIDKKSWIAASLMLTACLSMAAIAQDVPAHEADAPEAPATQPASSIIAVSDKAALDANKAKEVTVEGVVREAAWSGSGKVMNISFDGAEETKLAAVVFSKNKDRINQAFSGDAAKAWTGAKLRIRGTLRQYGGKVADRAGHPEITISDPSQVTVVEPAPATQPATQPVE